MTFKKCGKKTKNRNKYCEFCKRKNSKLAKIIVIMTIVAIGSLVVIKITDKVTEYISRSTPEKTLETYVKKLNEYNYNEATHFYDTFSVSSGTNDIDKMMAYLLNVDDYRKSAKREKIKYEIVDTRELGTYFDMLTYFKSDNRVDLLLKDDKEFSMLNDEKMDIRIFEVDFCRNEDIEKIETQRTVFVKYKQCGNEWYMRLYNKFPLIDNELDDEIEEY